jgi:2-phospho-L-lactate guanylyltransferase (CobY/MobA/RfbA family)
LGTNALHVSPVNLIKFQYGKKSSLKHINSAKNVGVTPIMLPFDSLRFDVDTSSDLKELLAINPDLAERVKI